MKKSVVAANASRAMRDGFVTRGESAAPVAARSVHAATAAREIARIERASGLPLTAQCLSISQTISSSASGTASAVPNLL
ncbi:MAG TPA: hypothetical protein VL689_16060 [Paraburkholderia sp.]|jgi:hypothetical protein|nr:hypothetical protein [Paraburkholderia sp.]